MSARDALRQRGATLVELIVASLLVGLIMSQVLALIVYGNRFYLKVRSQTEVQRSALLAFRWINSDLMEGTSFSFRFYQEEDGGPAFSFGSPKTEDGGVEYDTYGRLLWSSVIGYYLDSDDEGVLYRVLLAIPSDERSVNPPVMSRDEHGPIALRERGPGRVIARHVHSIEIEQGPENIEVVLHARHQELGFGLKLQTKLEMRN